MSAVVSDTHSLIWFLNDSSKLSVDALAAFEKAERGGFSIYVPAIILIEMRYLIEKGRDIFESDLERVINELNSSTSALTFAPLNQATSIDIENIPRATVPDMPDRLIAATAYNLNLPLVTKDGNIRKLNNVAVIW